MANLRNVKVVLYEPDRDLRSVLLGKLRELEFEDILDTPTVDSVEQAFLDGEVDLAILGTTRENDVMCRLLRDIRQGERGDNPFPVAIATCDAASEKHMRSVIDAGFDNALIKPFDAASIARRVRHFCQSRNPFVVTHDYIGPDRRSEKRRVGADPKLIDAPNPVRILADGHSRDFLGRQISAARGVVDEEKLQKDAASIQWLVDRLCVSAIISDTNAVEQCGLLAAQIHRQAENMLNRSTRTEYAHVADMCMTVAEIAMRIATAGRIPDTKDVELLENLNKAIFRAMSSDETDAGVIRDIRASALMATEN